MHGATMNHGSSMHNGPGWHGGGMPERPVTHWDFTEGRKYE